MIGSPRVTTSALGIKPAIGSDDQRIRLGARCKGNQEQENDILEIHGRSSAASAGRNPAQASGSTVHIELDTSHSTDLYEVDDIDAAMTRLAIDPELVRRPHDRDSTADQHGWSLRIVVPAGRPGTFVDPGMTIYCQTQTAETNVFGRQQRTGADTVRIRGRCP
jgi:hypothetical protein